jgi:hypothetical protein
MVAAEPVERGQAVFRCYDDGLPTALVAPAAPSSLPHVSVNYRMMDRPAPLPSDWRVRDAPSSDNLARGPWQIVSAGRDVTAPPVQNVGAQAQPPTPDLAPFVTPSLIAARHAGHCPTCHRTTREPGETRAHWWLCGCPVEPEGHEALYGGNLPERDVLVWGGRALGTGWTLDEAEAAWRAGLAEEQREPTHATAVSFAAALAEERQRRAARLESRVQRAAIGAVADACGGVAAFAKASAAFGAPRKAVSR